MSRYLVGLGGLSLVLLTLVFLTGPDEPVSSTAVQPRKPIYVPVADPPSEHTRSPADVQSPRIANDRDLDLKTVWKIGLLQRETRWIDEAMDAGFWTRKSMGNTEGDGRGQTDGSQVWENQNGERLTWWTRNGRIMRAEAEFPDGSTSASVTALAIYFVGTNHDIPVKMEDPRPGSKRTMAGNFFTPDGRRFFFRGRLRDDGEDISGPAHFEIGMEPFDGQSRLEPPIDGFIPD